MHRLAGARGALNVGLVVTVTPSRPIDIRVTKDGTVADPALTAEALEVEVNAEVDIDIGDVAAVLRITSPAVREGCSNAMDWGY